MSARILSIMLAVRVLSIFGRSTSGGFGVAAVDLSGDKDEMASDPELRYRWALLTFQEGLRFDAAVSRDFCLSSFVSHHLSLLSISGSLLSPPAGAAPGSLT